MIVDEGGSFLAKRDLMATLGNEYRLLVLYPYRDYVEEGGPMAYITHRTSASWRSALPTTSIKFLTAAKLVIFHSISPTSFSWSSTQGRQGHSICQQHLSPAPMR